MCIHQHGERSYSDLRNGTLGVYRIKPNGILKGLVRWPAAFA